MDARSTADCFTWLTDVVRVEENYFHKNISDFHEKYLIIWYIFTHIPSQKPVPELVAYLCKPRGRKRTRGAPPTASSGPQGYYAWRKTIFMTLSNFHWPFASLSTLLQPIPARNTPYSALGAGGDACTGLGGGGSRCGPHRRFQPAHRVSTRGGKPFPHTSATLFDHPRGQLHFYSLLLSENKLTPYLRAENQRGGEIVQDHEPGIATRRIGNRANVPTEAGCAEENYFGESPDLRGWILFS